jgi:O-antigen/teichoic acid export membrane protein
MKILKIIKKLRTFQKQLLQQDFFNQVKVSFVYQILGTIVAFIAQVLLVRMLGVELFGVYTLGISWLTLGVVFAKVGLDAGGVRYFPKFLVEENFQAIRTYIKQSYSYVSAISLLVATLLILALQFNLFSFSASKVIFISLILIALPFRGLLDINNAYFQVNKKFGWVIAPRSIFLPLLFILVIGGIYLSAYELTPSIIAISYVSISFLIVAISAMTLRKQVKSYPKKGTSVDFKGILKVCIVLSLVNGINFIYQEMDILMLGFLSTEKNIGWYGAIIKITLLLKVSLNAINLVVAPDISKAYNANDKEGLQALLFRTSKLLIVISVLVGGTIILMGKWILAFFGPSFIAMYPVLLILVGGQLFNTLTGPVGFLLSMTKYERLLFKITLASLLLNFILNYYLIPLHGIYGAAVATTISLGVRNLVVMIFAKIKLKIKPTIFF